MEQHGGKNSLKKSVPSNGPGKLAGVDICHLKLPHQPCEEDPLITDK